MKQTANTQLNQWERTDRILMSDFNSDNQKLDSALAALAGEDTSIRQSIAAMQTQIDALALRTAPVILKEYTDTAGGNPIQVDLSFIDWDLYDRIFVESRLLTYNSNSYSIYGFGSRSTTFGYAYSKVVGRDDRPADSLNRLTIYPHGDKNRVLRIENHCYGVLAVDQVYNILGSELNTLSIYAHDDTAGMAPGCYFLISGVRA